MFIANATTFTRVALDICPYGRVRQKVKTWLVLDSVNPRQHCSEAIILIQNKMDQPRCISIKDKVLQLIDPQKNVGEIV